MCFTMLLKYHIRRNWKLGMDLLFTYICVQLVLSSLIVYYLQYVEEYSVLFGSAKYICAQKQQ